VFQLHQAPDPGAVGAEVGLNLGGHILDGGQIDAQQLRAPLQRRRDRRVAAGLLRWMPGKSRDEWPTQPDGEQA
jgi:hypothetical protein